MGLSRRDLFRRIGSRRTLRSLGDLVLRGLDGALISRKSPGYSFEESIWVLRNARRKRSPRLDSNARLTRSDHPGKEDSEAPSEDRQA